MLLITPPTAPLETWLSKARVALTGGEPGEVGLLFRRAPEVAFGSLLDEASSLAALCSSLGAPLWVSARRSEEPSDALALALEVGAHLHLPAWSLSSKEARPFLPEGRLISVSVHDLAEAGRAVGADLALVSPVFSPGSKPGDERPPLGPEGFSRLARGLERSVRPFALGGMTPERLALLPEAAGAAILTSVWSAAAPEALVRALLAARSR